MAATNSILTPSVICKEIAYQVSNNLKFAGSVYRAPEEDFSRNVNGWLPGDNVDVRLPVQYTVGTTASVASGQNFIQVKKNLKLDQRRVVALEFTSEQLTWGLPRFSDDVIKPAALRLANSIDQYMASLAKQYVAQNYTGTAGTVNGLGHIFGARQYLMNAGAPMQGNYMALNTAHVASLMPVLGTLFNNTYTDPLLKEGVFGNTAGCTVWESQNMQSQTFGTLTGGSAVLEAAWTMGTAPSSGTIGVATVTMSFTGTIQPGQIFTQATLYGVKALSQGDSQSTGQLKQFVFLGTGGVGTAMTTGTGAALFSENPIGAGPYQNVCTSTGATVASVASAGVLVAVASTGNATHPQSLLYNPNFAALACVPLALPDGAAWKARESVNGISVRLVKDYSGLSDLEVTRADILFAATVINPGLACKIT